MGPPNLEVIVVLPSIITTFSSRPLAFKLTGRSTLLFQAFHSVAFDHDLLRPVIPLYPLIWLVYTNTKVTPEVVNAVPASGFEPSPVGR